MPKYEYRCTECNAMREVNRPIDDRDSDLACEECGSNSKRVFNAPAIRFVGGGFYSTGNR